MRGAILFVVALIILGICFIPGLIYGLCTINENTYLFDLAQSIDRFGNVLLGPILNKILITSDGYKFGNGQETMSSATGRNVIKGTLTPIGIKFNNLLSFCFGHDHAINSIGF